MIPPSRFLLVPALLLLGRAYANDEAPRAAQGATSSTVAVPNAGEGDSAAPVLAPYRLELLDIAFRAASALPVEPHVKTRSRAQAEVVETCLELEQPELAAVYAKDLVNWRRGSAFADLAMYNANRGDAKEVKTWLALAEGVSRSSADTELQGWRRERILAKIASVHLILGDEESAARYTEAVGDSERGELLSTVARVSGEDELEGQLAALEHAATTSNFELVRGHLGACLELFRARYDDAEARESLEAGMRAAWQRVPGQVRIELLSAMAEAATSHGELERAGAYLDDALAYVDGGRWTPEYELPLRAGLAELRFAAGDEERARRELDVVREAYGKQRDRIVNIYRAGTLRPLAEAYAALGEREVALDLYRRAVEEGVENPNSRPRATDLVSTCVSMTLSEVEPDPTLVARILAILEGLGDPW